MRRKILSMIEEVVWLRQQEQTDDDNQETYCPSTVNRKLANDNKSHTSALTDFT